MTPASPDDPLLLARIEDAGINASAPPAQLWVDGWLLRFSPDKAKRARCIQAVADGLMPVPAKLARCLPVFAAHGLHPYVRITPFSRPAGLDDELASLGYERIDETLVMTLALGPQGVPGAAGFDDVGTTQRSVGTADFAAWIGAARGSSTAEIEAHAARLVAAPVAHHALLRIDEHGVAVAGGQAAIEGDVAGLYDVFTLATHRGRGHAAALCRALLAEAAGRGARIAYLQVDAAHASALRIYRRLGFVEGYRYHYRTPAGAPAGGH